MALNPWVILGIVLLWIASLGAVGWKANEIGHKTERSDWLNKENAELVAANKKIQDLQNDARKTEQEHAARLAEIGAAHAKEMVDKEAQRRRDLAAIRDGALKLRIASSRICPGGSSPSETGPTPGERDGAATVELPQQITSDLFDLANDADQVADQLRACQGVIQSDRSVSR